MQANKRFREEKNGWAVMGTHTHETPTKKEDSLCLHVLPPVMSHLLDSLLKPSRP